MTVDRAMELLCMKGGYGYKKLADDLYVVGATEPNNPTFQKYAETRVVPVDYRDAEEVIALLPHYAMYLSARNGVLTVRAWPNQLPQILADIATIDQPVRQVEGTVIIAEVTAEAKVMLGLGKIVGGVSTKDQVLDVDGLSVSFSDSVTIASLLQVMQAQGKAQLKASTSIVVPEGSQSTISLGREVRQLIQSQTNTGQTIDRIEVNTYLTLGVERVTSRDEIRLYYEVVAQDLAQSVTSPLPEVLTRLANGRVIVENNAAFVIGGLTKSVQQENSGAIPPYALQNTQDTELLILILPHILGTPRLEQDPLEDYYTKFIQEKEVALANANPRPKENVLQLGLATHYSPGLTTYLASQGVETAQFRTGFTGRLYFTRNVGLYWASSDVRDRLTEVKTRDWGVLLASSANMADVYLGLGQGKVKITGEETTVFRYYAARAGMDLKLGPFRLGVGYQHAFAEPEAPDLDTTYFSLGLAF